MKLAFSSVACPGWNLATMVEKAREYGYQGIELRGLEGQMHLPLAPQLAANPAKIAKLMRDTGVELVCLASSAAFHMRDPKQVAENQAQAREYIDLASKLECPFVRVFGAEIPKAFIGYEKRETVLGRIATALRGLAGYAADRRVTILIENSGDFVDSAALWYLVDAADSPAVKCCWNPFAARARRERPTTSIPRLGSQIGLVHVTDGKFDDAGVFEGYALPGQGTVELPRLVQLLKGIGYRGYLVFDWPKLWTTSLADADKALPAAAKFLKPLLDEKPVPLTAYKGDKYAPRQGYEHVAS
ncbi:MAG TPA: sugar phosphate isomerase/epimerase family protein [Phycisphaerae bacterium]|nr:sugar phosphate isomerase/epimerase family protein [Phycisphaerae bacterium]